MTNYPSQSEIYSGTYTVDVTNISNTGSTTAYPSLYTRVGNIVTISARIAVTPIAAGLVAFHISLPIQTNHPGNSVRTIGSGSWTYSTTLMGSVSVWGEGVNSARARVQFIAENTSAVTLTVTFQYEIA